MQIDTDTLEIQRAKKAAKIASEVSGEDHTDLETPIFVLSKSYQQLNLYMESLKALWTGLTVWNGQYFKS